MGYADFPDGRYPNMPLTALTVRQAKSKIKPYKLFDELGLLLIALVACGKRRTGRER